MPRHLRHSRPRSKEAPPPGAHVPNPAHHIPTSIPMPPKLVSHLPPTPDGSPPYQIRQLSIPCGIPNCQEMHAPFAQSGIKLSSLLHWRGEILLTLASGLCEDKLFIT